MCYGRSLKLSKVIALFVVINICAILKCILSKKVKTIMFLYNKKLCAVYLKKLDQEKVR